MRNSTKTIKTANSFLVLDALRRSAGLTVEQMMRATHLSRPTVLSILEEQMQRQVITAGGKVASDFGRQPILYTLNTHHYFAIGIDFEFPPMRLCITDLTGHICFERQWLCSPDLSRSAIIDRLCAEIETAMAAMSLTIDNIIGIGVGIPGTVNKQSNTSQTISRISDWNKEPLHELLSRRFPVPIYLRNDAHLMSHAATARLGLDGRDFLFIAYRTGIGMAIIRNGELVDGSFGNTGYLGHTTVDPDGDICSCGNRGCLETVSSRPTIERRYAEQTGKHIPFADLLHQPDAADLLSRAGRWFGIALANAIKLLDIYTVVIDGLPINEDHPLIAAIRNTAQAACNAYAVRDLDIRPTAFPEGEGALGAALFVLDTFFQKPRLHLTT